MKTIFGSKNFPKDSPGTAVALGNFDGVHLGHRRIIECAQSAARDIRGKSVVYTFNPHPVTILSPAERPRLIQTLEQRLASLEALGVDFCCVEEFTQEFAAQSPENFFKSILIERLDAKTVVVGYDFTFGLHRAGSTGILTELGSQHGVKIHIVEAQFLGGTLISSTCIRSLISRGDVKEAAALLGRRYAIEGIVIAGMGIGKTLGAHTANLKSDNELIPMDGVYVTRTNAQPFGALRAQPSVTSIGNNPTFPNAKFAIETHIIGANVELLGKKIRIEFLDRLRDQKTFSSKEELAEQIRRDIEEAKKVSQDIQEGEILVAMAMERLAEPDERSHADFKKQIKNQTD